MPENIVPRRKIAAYGQQSALLYMYDIQPKTVNSVKNGQEQLKTVKNGQKWSNLSKTASNCQCADMVPKMRSMVQKVFGMVLKI